MVKLRQQVALSVVAPRAYTRRLVLMQSQDTALIPLRARDGSVRAYATVDASDADWVNQWRWHLDNRGYAVRSEYGEGFKGGRAVLLHRSLLGLEHGDGVEGDHINRVRLDNRRSNLRRLPRGLNPQNQSSFKGSSSRFRGVCWDKEKSRWLAYVYVGRRQIKLGRFVSEDEAAQAARAGRLRWFPYALD